MKPSENFSKGKKQIHLIFFFLLYGFIFKALIFVEFQGRTDEHLGIFWWKQEELVDFYRKVNKWGILASASSRQRFPRLPEDVLGNSEICFSDSKRNQSDVAIFTIWVIMKQLFSLSLVFWPYPWLREGFIFLWKVPLKAQRSQGRCRRAAFRVSSIEASAWRDECKTVWSFSLFELFKKKRKKKKRSCPGAWDFITAL